MYQNLVVVSPRVSGPWLLANPTYPCLDALCTECGYEFKQAYARRAVNAPLVTGAVALLLRKDLNSEQAERSALLTRTLVN